MRVALREAGCSDLAKRWSLRRQARRAAAHPDPDLEKYVLDALSRSALANVEAKVSGKSSTIARCDSGRSLSDSTFEPPSSAPALPLAASASLGASHASAIAQEFFIGEGEDMSDGSRMVDSGDVDVEVAYLQADEDGADRAPSSFSVFRTHTPSLSGSDFPDVAAHSAATTASAHGHSDSKAVHIRPDRSVLTDADREAVKHARENIEAQQVGDAISMRKDKGGLTDANREHLKRMRDDAEAQAIADILLLRMSPGKKASNSWNSNAQSEHIPEVK